MFASYHVLNNRKVNTVFPYHNFLNVLADDLTKKPQRDKGNEYVCRTRAQRAYGYNGYQVYNEESEIFICEFCKDIISTEYHVYVSAYLYEKDHDFDKLMAWRKTFLKICYLHFRLTGTKLPGRNIYRDALIGTPNNSFPRGSGKRGRGRQPRGQGRRGRPVVDW